MLIDYMHKNGHREIIEVPTPRWILDQIKANPASLAPRPTVEQPSDEELAAMSCDGADCEATDGCTVDPDGICPHGHVPWLVYLATRQAAAAERRHSKMRQRPARPPELWASSSTGRALR